MALVAVVQSGFTVSSALQLERGDRPFSIGVPVSYTPGDLRIQFSDALTTNSIGWGSLQKNDGTGLVHLVFTGAGPAWSAPIFPATPFFRLRMSATAALANSFYVVPLYSPA